MILLGIDTSCDDTGIALVRNGVEVLSSCVSSQAIHGKYGGIVPELASRAHLTNFIPLLDRVFKTASLSPDGVDAVAVTEKPGLPGALITGLTYARGIAASIAKPITYVDHIKAHVCSAYLTQPELEPPFFALVVSGGHTSLLDVRSRTDFRNVGSTRDDAAGEAYDKVAKILGLGYPGGVEIDRLCANGAPGRLKFTRPYLPGTPDFSFSGIKTQVMYYMKDRKKTAAVQREVAFAFSDAVTDVLVKKTTEYAAKHGRRRIVIAGGVASNSMLRGKFASVCAKEGLELFIPERKYCTDNGAMVAACGYWQLKK